MARAPVSKFACGRRDPARRVSQRPDLLTFSANDVVRHLF